MGASQSNLSDPHYGFDVVVAVTQTAVNDNLGDLLGDLSAPEVILCYVYDANNDVVAADFDTVVASANGSNPFEVADGQPSTNPDLVNLTNANFAGAVKASIGLPDIKPADIPPIVTLGAGTSAPVLFNLLCAEFQVTAFVYGPRGSVTWVNQSPPTPSPENPDPPPWYFSANVNLNSAPVAVGDTVPLAVQQRIGELEHQVENAFTLQKLFLELDSAILESTPTIEGPLASSQVWGVINQYFIKEYFDSLQQNGNPVLSYSFTVDAPRPTTLDLGTVSVECCPLLDGHGQVIPNPTPAQLAATSLVYVGTQSTTVPVPVPFAWNWVETTDQFYGVQSVRRDVFMTYFNQLVNADVSPLSVDTNVTFTQNSTDFLVDYSNSPSTTPQTFQPVVPPGPAGTDGFTTVSTLTFSCPSSADESGALDTEEISGVYNYSLTGTIALQNNQIRIMVRATVEMSFKHREGFVQYTDLHTRNYYDKTLTVVYGLGVGQDGTLQVSPTHAVNDQSAKWDFKPQGVLGSWGLEDSVKNGLTSVQQDLDDYLDSAFITYVDQMTDTINGYSAWVFAGNDAFTFAGVSFSQGLDLVSELTYLAT